MDDLWAEASFSHEAVAREAALARADAELETVMPFLLAARSQQEFEHRAAYARESILSIAARCGIDEDDLMATAARRFGLYRQALAEGTDVMDQLERSLDGSGFGSGPEKADEHDKGPDYAHGYSEVPQGAPGGPDPRVTQVRPPAAGPVQEATGSLRRRADSSPQDMMTMPYMPLPPDTGTGPGSVDTQVAGPNSGGIAPSLPAGTPGGAIAPTTDPSIGQVTSSSDPVRRKVMAVTAAIAASNPQLAAPECERVARQVVGRYLHEADLTSSVVDDQPVSGGDGGSGSSGGSGSGLAGRMLEGQGLRSMLPSGGSGGGAAEAGEAAEMLAAL